MKSGFENTFTGIQFDYKKDNRELKQSLTPQQVVPIVFFRNF